MLALGERRSRRRRDRAVASAAAALLAAGATLGVPANARGQAAAGSGDDDAADRLFEEGRNLLEQGDYASACPKLRASYAIDPAVGALLALALCEERAGRVATAAALYQDVVLRARAQRDGDREAAARARVAELTPTIPRLRVTAAGPVATAPGLTWYVDGDRYEALLLQGGAPFDPGQHVVEVRDAGGRSRRIDVTLELGRTATVTVDAWESTVTAPPPAAAPPPPADAPPPAQGLTGAQTAGLVVGGVGVLGLGVGALFGVLALGERAELDDAGTCDDVPDFDVCADAYDAAKRDATIATVGLVAGGVLTAAGVGLLVLGAPDDAATGRGALTVAVRGARVDARLTF